MLAMAQGEDRRAFRFGWSVWRRAHQAVAAGCAAARRARTADRPRPRERASRPEPSQTGLTDAQWRAVQTLLPPQSPPIGRPRHDHRRLLGGILWVVRTRASWRDLPPEYGKWETAYKRYRLWHDSGLWTQLIAALDRHAATQPNEVAL